jgi:phosphatidate cytidylyltransferase
MREVIVRAISGVLYILIVIFSMYTSREWFMALFFVFGILVLREFLKLVHLTSYLAYILLAAALYFLSYKIFADQAVTLYLIASCFVSLFLLKDMLWTSKIPMFEKKKYITTIFYIISGFVFLTLIPFVDGTFMPEIIVAVFSLIWANDTMAYIIGKSFGKHKLLERISPKKTIEGFLGGLAGSFIAGFIIFKITDIYSEQIYSLQTWLCLAVIASVFGTVGDLVQSKFKRQAGVKDSGNLMPGHGGLYDRLDSIVYASPFIFAFLEIVDYVS